MPPSRFAQKEHLSYRNLLAIPAKKEVQFSEIPVLTNGTDSEDLIAATSQYWITKHTNQGHLTFAPYHKPGKLANKTASLSACSGSISDFTTCPFDQLLAVANEAGETSIFSLPETLNPSGDTQAFNCIRKLHGESKNSPVDKLAFHSTTRGILAGSIGTQLAIWDAEHLSEGSPSINLASGAKVWDIKWGWDGRLLGATTRTGILQLWDPRASTMVSSCDNQDGSGGRKCSRLAWVGDHILTTSVNKLRDRQYSIFDPRSLNSPVKTERIDNSNGTLIPIVDPNRSILYLATRGESTFKWYKLNLSSTLTVEAFNSMLPMSPIAGIAMAPINHQTVDVMRTELCKFMILTKSAEVIPLTIQAPKRQYLDFHADVMPSVRSMEPAQAGQDWLKGNDQTVALVSQDPSAPGSIKSSIKSTPISTALQPTPASGIVQSSIKSAPATATMHQESPQAPGSPKNQLPATGPASYGVKKSFDAKPSDPAPSQSVVKPISKKGVVNKPVRWSRKYVNGQTSMQAEYEDLHNLSATFPADREMIKCTSSFFLVPIGGPGGRLGVHRLTNKGRLPTRLPCLINEANIVAFEVDQLVQGRVFVAGEDGKVRVFRVPEQGLEEDSLNAELILSASSMDRISLIKPHPTAKDILLTISDDMNKPCVRLWYVGQVGDTASGPSREIHLPSGAISSASWSLDGSLLAIANKAKTLYVLDPRRGDDTHWCQGSTHGSSRPVQVTWTDDRSHLLTTGFSSTGMREVKLYQVNQEQHAIESLAAISFDNSPAGFFIHYDPDTSIGYCWSKGERTTYLIELIETPNPNANPGQSTFKFDRLTPFVHSTIQLGYSFFIKQVLDVKAVEVGRALRLTGNQVEVVSFKIPRNRAEFFQDDIFCDTRDLLTPAFQNGQDWLDLLGQNDPQEDRQEKDLIEGFSRVSLQPVGMSRLSEAPLTKVQSNQKALIAQGPQLTDSQKADQYLDKLFQSAKRDDHHQLSGSSTSQSKLAKPDKDDDDDDEEEEVVGRSRVGAPVDDDW
ncbi:Coronin-7 [Puccinia graminis f. sp. tritici]|uniref:Coronin-7 n=1 Tax=Puccinia graminis f. sp. tritici TaxID=56615 RepID=A0A5B0R190_PUCGR|nr:Coronin-7 [Puccinia graminis f. sp. tritici]